MVYNPDTHHRKSIRLKDYDYSQAGIYFVTINIKEELATPYLLGDIVDDEVILSNIGKIVNEVWEEIPDHFEGVELDSFVIMPNHMHGIIIIYELDIMNNNVGIEKSQNRGVVPEKLALKKRSLGSMVGSFKAEVSRRVNRKLNTDGRSFWQRNYYEHIIRNEKELEIVRSYIENNPINWGNL